MSRAAALAVLAAGCGVFALWELLAAAEGTRLPALGERLLAPLRRVRREGVLPSAPERRRLAVVAAGVLLGAGWLVGGPVLGAAVALCGPWLAFGVVRARRRRYLAELERDAPVVARAVADALSGGHSIRGALSEAARGLTGAAGIELRRAARALELGEPTEAVLEQLRARTAARAYDTMVAAMLLQREAGGDLARLLRELAAALEDALRLEGDARTATAQARFTGLLVAVLPLGAAGLAELAAPGYVAGLLRAPLTAWLLGCALAFQAIALVAIQRLARVRA